MKDKSVPALWRTPTGVTAVSQPRYGGETPSHVGFRTITVVVCPQNEVSVKLVSSVFVLNTEFYRGLLPVEPYTDRAHNL